MEWGCVCLWKATSVRDGGRLGGVLFAGVIFQSGEFPTEDWETSPRIGAGQRPPRTGAGVLVPRWRWGQPRLCFERRNRHPVFRADSFSPTLACGGDAGGRAGAGAARGAGATRYGFTRAPGSPRTAPRCPGLPRASIGPGNSASGVRHRSKTKTRPGCGLMFSLARRVSLVKFRCFLGSRLK